MRAKLNVCLVLAVIGLMAVLVLPGAAIGAGEQIERLEIGGFRGLSGPFAFTPGLNLVAGDNEAGKSTLHDALIRSLYGFAAPERRRFKDQAAGHHFCFRRG